MNLFLAPRLEPLVGYGPETVTNYEVGFKGTLASGRVRLNADIFLMDYQDKQEAVQIDNSDGRYGPDSTLEFTQNAASVNIYGIEFELRASPWDGGFVTLDFGYLIDEYDQFIVYDPDTDGPQDRSILNVDGPAARLDGQRVAGPHFHACQRRAADAPVQDVLPGRIRVGGVTAEKRPGDVLLPGRLLALGDPRDLSAGGGQLGSFVLWRQHHRYPLLQLLRWIPYGDLRPRGWPPGLVGG